MTPSRQRALPFWFAATLSVATHAAAFALLFSGRAPVGRSDLRPLAVDACALAEEPPAVQLAQHTIPSPPTAPAGPQPISFVPTLTPPPASMTQSSSPRLIPDFAKRPDSPSAANGSWSPGGANYGVGAGDGGVVTAFFQAAARG